VLRVGLTGGIACGKSEVLRRLAAGGLPTLDLDRLAHELMAPGQPAFGEVVSAFGPSVLGPDGAIDRKVLGALVFADPAARERLDRIVHPRVRDEESRRARAAEAEGASVFVTDAALLVEAGLHLRFDRLLVVHCRKEQQVARLLTRDGMGETAARARLRAQMPIETKRRFAHIAVDTSLDLADTHAKADALAGELRILAARRPSPISLPRGRVRRCLALASEAAGPRGLSVPEVAAHVARTGGLELAALAARLEPPTPGPWWKAGDEMLVEGAPSTSRGEPASLVVPVVLHELARHGHDEERIAASAHSLAWLTERSSDRLASAVLYALVLAQVAARGSVPPDLETGMERFLAIARRWSGGEPGPVVPAAIRHAVRNPQDPAAARSSAGAAGAEAALAGALVAAGIDVPHAEAGSSEADVFASFVDALAR
jgi:dephospho-CoA kinase